MLKRLCVKDGVLMTIGLVFLVLASVSNWLLRSSTLAGADFVRGALYGVTIGTLLLAIRRKATRRGAR